MPSYASSSGGGRKKKRARKADSGGGRGQRDYTSLLGLLLLDAETRAAVAEQDSEEVEVLIEHLKALSHLSVVDDGIMNLVAFQAQLLQLDPGSTWHAPPGLHFVLQGTLLPASLPPSLPTQPQPQPPPSPSAAAAALHASFSSSSFHSLPLIRPRPPLTPQDRAAFLFKREKGDFFYVSPSSPLGEEEEEGSSKSSKSNKKWRERAPPSSSSSSSFSSSSAAAAAASAGGEDEQHKEYRVPPKASSSTLLLHIPLQLAQELMAAYDHLAAARQPPPLPLPAVKATSRPAASPSPSPIPSPSRPHHEQEEEEEETESEGEDQDLDKKLPASTERKHTGGKPSSSSAAAAAVAVIPPAPLSSSSSLADDDDDEQASKPSFTCSRSPSPSAGFPLQAPPPVASFQPQIHRSSTRTAAQLANTRKELSLKEIERQARMLMAERLGVRADKIKMEAIDTDALPGSFEYDTMRRNMSTAPEMVLFHGTSYQAALSISANNFDPNKFKARVGEGIRHLYLASDPRVAGRYASGWNDWRYMLVCRVLYYHENVSFTGCTGGSIKVLGQSVRGMVLPLFRASYEQREEDRLPAPHNREALESGDHSQLQAALTRYMIMGRGCRPNFLLR